MKFKQFIESNDTKLNEVMLTFGGKTSPKFGQVLIMAGGAASGKGFVKNNLVGIEGIVFDVDRLKELVINSQKLNSKIKVEYGKDASKLSLKNPEDVKFLHNVITGMKINDNKIKAVITSIYQAYGARKPNLIFDVTLKDLTKFINIMNDVKDMGYYKKNINLVWVLNTIDLALFQNTQRNRMVPEDILIATHEGASYTMKQILNMGDKITKYMDGEIYLAFNQVKVDSELKKSNNGGKYIKKANYFLLKPRNGKIIKDLDKDIINKIKRYVPDSSIWN